MPLERMQVRRPPRGVEAPGDGRGLPAAAVRGATAQATTTTESSRSHSPTGTATSTASSSSALLQQGTLAQQARRYEDENIRSLLHQLPSSPKQLMRRLEQQQQEINMLKETNMLLKSREVEISSLTLRLQERINATQSQVDHIKTQVHLQLSNPITEEEYQRIESLTEAQRDLVDVMKLGIYRQLGSLRASQQAATKRAAELSTSLAQLQQENSDMKVRLAECESQGGTEKEKAERMARQIENQQARIAELEGHIASLEAKNRSMYVDQEQFLSAKLTAQIKTDEVARLSVRLEESEMDTQRYRANAECTEQKLDILKSEYYELKLRNGQRVLELENALKASEEKLKTLGDLEMESQLFISNLATSSQGDVAFSTDPADTSAGRPTDAYEGWLALPRSRKLAHTLVVTKRCLHLENKVAALEHDLNFKQAQVARLQVALDGARDALHNINSPYVLVEKAMTELTDENEALKQKVNILEQDKKELQLKVQQYGSSLRTLTHHRQELLRIKKLLRQLGLREGFVLPTVDEETRQMESQQPETGKTRHTRSRSASGGDFTSSTQPRASMGSSASEARRAFGKESPGSFGALRPIEMTF
ncbi:hypothetical protein, conserved [Leishmania donovani]|uniref:Uncharacterized protein n=1 Tax=Leishmania donovani TaxID=5661 RepID=E9B8X3_LEIDO|nr:hypothetical protein, conserved [Leishmania donovani]TPP54802.1 hypothetical protein CGC21_24045 [Leishmania donovani]CBZ31696.1 hypothetical protein, conserved [Leishmania donovani]